MASIRFRSNKWQARVSRKGEQSLVKTFQSKEDAERWARSIEVEWDRGTYANTHQAQKTTFGELIERYLREVTPLMRGAKADTIRLKAILEEASKVIRSYKWRPIPFRQEAATLNYITLKCGIRMAVRVGADCSWLIGMTSPLTTLRLLALTNQQVSG